MFPPCRLQLLITKFLRVIAPKLTQALTTGWGNAISPPSLARAGLSLSRSQSLLEKLLLKCKHARRTRHSQYSSSGVRPRFFDQVGHETMYASIANKHFFTKSCHHQTYQNYEQSQQKSGTILENKVCILKIKIFKNIFQ